LIRRLLLLASAIVLVDTTFYGAVTPLLPFYADHFGLSKGQAGVLAAAYPAGTFAGSLPGGWVAARLGVRPTVLSGLALMTLASVGFAFGTSIAVLDVARFVQGIGGAFSWAGAMGWLIGAAPRERRGELIGSAMGAAIAGALLGPVLGTLAHALGPKAVFSSVGLVGVALGAWAVRTPAAGPSGTDSVRSLVRLVRDGQVATSMWLITMPGLLFGTIGVLAPLRLHSLGAATAAIGAVFLLAAALEAVESPLIGRLSDRRGRLGPSLVGLAGSAVVMALLPWPQSPWLLALLVVIGSPVIGILWSPAIAMLSDRAEALGMEQAVVFALLNLGWSVGQTCGDAGSARLAQATSDTVPYLLLAFVCLVTYGRLKVGRAGKAGAHGHTASRA
jgi:MFS family permease